jgi:hypothetical protein
MHYIDVLSWSIIILTVLKAGEIKRGIVYILSGNCYFKK